MEDDSKGLDTLSHHQDSARPPEIALTASSLATIKEVLQHPIAPKTLGKGARSVPLDLDEYKNRLNKVWGYNHTSTAQGLVASITADIATLNATLDHTSGEDEKAMRNILCRYLQAYGHIMRDQGQYTEAIIALEEAVGIAQRANNSQLLAATLLRLGGIYNDRGDVILAQSKLEGTRGDSTGANVKRANADADFQAAVKQFARARSMKKISPELNIALLIGDGNTQARIAHGNKDVILAALALLEQAEKIITDNYFNGSEGDEYSIFASSMDLAQRRLHISKASALLAAGWSHEALQELTEMLNLPSQSTMTRMNAYTNLLWAQGYADTGKLDGAALLAQDTLAVMKRIKSEVNIARIRGLYGQLINADSGQIEVIRLGVLLG